jgi:hypothetical protein
MRLGAPRGRWRDVVSGVEYDAGDDGLAVANLFAALPVAVLRRMG